MIRSLPSWCLAALISTPLTAQDPAMPPGGFPLTESLNQLYTYADGFRTRYDVRMPDPGQVAPPSTGWPCVMMVHGFPGARGFFGITGEAAALASRGYITLTYDVRGQGETRTLNPANQGTTFSARLEVADMAELFHALEAQLGSQMDFDRLGVTGTSQGGDHSWQAAVWSERQMPAPRGTITHFPKITVAQPRSATHDYAELWNPDGNAFAGTFSSNWFNANANIEATFASTVQNLFLTQDFAGFTTFMTTDPWRQVPAMLPQSTVPTMWMGSFDDFVFPQNEPIEGLGLLPATTPTRAYLTTGYHQSVRNNLEDAYQIFLAHRWIDRFMKGSFDDLDQQDRFQMVNVPANPAVANNPDTIWSMRQESTFPDTGDTSPTTLFLRAGSSLSPTAPTTAETPATVTHAVPPTFGPAQWVTTQNVTNDVLAQIPLSTALYRGAPLTEDLELIGEPTARIHIDSPAPNVQVHVVLFHENQSGGRRYISGGYRALRGRTPGVTAVDVDLRVLSYIIPAGDRIAVQIENHTWHRPIGVSVIRTAPYFESYQFDCLTTPAEASWIQIPTRSPALGCRTDSIGLSIANGGSIGVEIDGSPGRSGATYAVLASLSGAVPGFPFKGLDVPVNLDLMSSFGLQFFNVAPFGGFVGVLDGDGRATASFSTLPGQLPSNAFGALMTFGAITFEAGGGFSASASTQVRFEP